MAKTAINVALVNGSVSYTVGADKFFIGKAYVSAQATTTPSLLKNGTAVVALSVATDASPRYEAGPIVGNAGDIFTTSGTGLTIHGIEYDV